MSQRIGPRDVRHLDGPMLMRFRDRKGNEVAAIGVDDTNEGFVRIWNRDGSAVVFEVKAGVGIFPPAIGPWVHNHALVEDANGRPTYAGTINFAALLFCNLALTSAVVDLGNFGAEISAGTCDWQITVQAINTRDGHTSTGEVVAATNTGYSGSGSPFPSPIGIPNAIWSPEADPAGSIVRIRIEAKITSGGGTVNIYSGGDSARCI